MTDPHRIEYVYSGTELADSPSIDAFARLRVSTPFTLFDSKQLYNNSPLLWKEALISGGGITATYSVDRSSTTITSSNNTAGRFLRQTYQRFDYQPGKSQLIIMSAVIAKSGNNSESTTIRALGSYDDNNGVFFRYAGNTMYTGIRSSTSGSAVDTLRAQNKWNLDKMDGTGTSGVRLDFSKVQIFVFDYQWLGSGRVRFGFEVGGLIIYCHQELHANVASGVYMTAPNNPLRYELSMVTGNAVSLEAICSTIISEGGQPNIPGLHFNKSTGNTFINATTAGNIYIVCALRLKTTQLGICIRITNISVLATTNDNFEWRLVLNGTPANALTFSSVTNSACEFASGDVSNNPSNTTLSGGTILEGGYGSQQIRVASLEVTNIIRLGADTSNVPDVVYLCAVPLGSGSVNADIYGGMSWTER